jgi:hypothetical protein
VVAKRKRYYEKHREKIQALNRDWAVANKQQLAAAKQRYATNHREDLKAYHREYYQANKQHIKAQGEQWRRDHPDYLTTYEKAYYQAKKSTAPYWTKERQAERRKNDPEKWRRWANEWYARNKEQCKASGKRWIAENRAAFNETARVRNRNRQARINGNGGHHTKIDIRELYAKQGGKCVACAADLADGFHADHIMPVSRGGSNDIGNIQLLCAPCNLKKHAQHPSEWLKTLRTASV